MNHLQIKPYITEEQLQKKVAEIGAAITRNIRASKSWRFACSKFFYFLLGSDSWNWYRHQLWILRVSSYHGSTSSGEVKVTLDLANPVEGKHILLVEDIVDTGITMNYLKNSILARKPASLTTVALLEKPEALKVQCKIDHVGFQITNEFVVGYGLDYEGYYRNLPFIGQVQNFQ